MKAKDLQHPKKSGSGCLIICKRTDRFLLIQRSNYVASPSTWGLPGGKVEDGEDPLHAARRETMEEIGFDIGSNPIKLRYTNDSHAPRFRFYTYACIVDDEFSPTLNWESTDHRWCNLDDFPEPLHWGVQQMIAYDLSAEALKKFIEKHRD